jgi:hypothetical protein
MTKFLNLLLFFCTLWLLSCATAEKAHDTTQLKETERLIVGEIEIEFDNVKKDTGGLALTNIQLLIGTKEQLGWPDQDLSRVDCDMERSGCVFQVAFSKEEFYIHSIKTDAMTLWVHNGMLWPIHAKVASSENNCEYVGSFKVKIKGGKIYSKIHNQMESFKKNPKLDLKNCQLRANVARYDNSVPELAKDQRVKHLERKKKKRKKR